MKSLVIISVLLIAFLELAHPSGEKSKMQVKTTLPTFSIIYGELEDELNSFVLKELKCHPDNPDLVFSIRLFREFVSDTVVVVTIQSNMDIMSVIDLQPNGIKYVGGHQVFLFNIDTNDLVRTCTETVSITYEKHTEQSSKSDIPIISVEDDRYSMITYFFKDNELRLYEKSIKCP